MPQADLNYINEMKSASKKNNEQKLTTSTYIYKVHRIYDLIKKYIRIAFSQQKSGQFQDRELTKIKFSIDFPKNISKENNMDVVIIKETLTYIIEIHL